MKESLLGLDSWIAAAEEVSLQTASEGGKRRCRRDVLRQTVRDVVCNEAVPFHPYCGCVVTQPRNVSEHMLALALCLVVYGECAVSL